MESLEGKGVFIAIIVVLAIAFAGVTAAYISNKSEVSKAQQDNELISAELIKFKKLYLDTFAHVSRADKQADNALVELENCKALVIDLQGRINALRLGTARQ